MATIRNLEAPKGIMVGKDGMPLSIWYQWFALVGNVLLAVTSSGTTGQRPTKFLWVGRNYWNTDIGQMDWWDGAAWVTWGAGGGGAPTNATYVTMSLNATLTNERVLAVGSPITMVDGGANANVTLDFDETVTLGNNARVAVNKNSGATVGTRRRINFVEGANVTLTVADDAGNEEVDVTIAAASGGSTVVSGSATVDFGNTPGVEDSFATVTVASASIGAASEVLLTPRYSSALTDHDPDDYAAEGVGATVATVTPGVGFDILAFSRQGTWGQYNIDWAYV